MNLAQMLLLARLIVAGSWSQSRWRLVLTVLAIMLGVALGTAVIVINHSAASELTAAVRALSGTADVSVQGPRSGFDESLYPQLARRNEVVELSPALEIDAKLVDRPGTLRILGIDPFRALSLQPTLLGDASDRIVDLLQPGTAMLSQSAAQALGLREGDLLRVQVGLATVEIRVLGILPVNDATRQPLALMDIAAAQWTFDQLGLVSRIDLRLREGTNTTQFLAHLSRALPPGVHASEARIASEQSLALSRAYRVNLNMLALVALFTGAVLVFSVQTLSLLRRRTQFALLRALGLSHGALATLLVSEALLLGALGTAGGIALGIAAAHFGLAHIGGDLGAGFFAGTITRVWLDPVALLAVGVSAIGTCAVAGAIPAIGAARTPPGPALHAGDEQRMLARLRGGVPATCFALLGIGLALAPAIDGLPYLGYAAIACLLIAALLAAPAGTRLAIALIPLPPLAPLRLGLQQLRGTTGIASISLATILAAFSFTVAMLIMTHSFRGSLAGWLEIVLPADIYARAGPGASAWIAPDLQERMRTAPGVARIAFIRHTGISLRADLPSITLIARDLDPRQPDGIPLLAPQRLPEDAGAVPVWISEAMRDLHGYAMGQRFILPLAGRDVEVVVAGIWRDYVRIGGAVLMPRAEYVRLTADLRANEAWIWLADRTTAAKAIEDLRAALATGTQIELRDPGTLRSLSLATFDRTFAVTYALQVVALAIGLFGISAGASAQTVARRREFGVLRHLGMSRRDIGAMVAFEGAVVGGLGALAGSLVGLVISIVLIQVINRQSFHWSMELSIPWGTLAPLAGVLMACASLTAAISARRAQSDDVVRAVREDW